MLCSICALVMHPRTTTMESYELSEMSTADEGHRTLLDTEQISQDELKLTYRFVTERVFQY